MSVVLTPKRYIDAHLSDFIKSKMVFIGGPRQVGKTTYALYKLGTKKGAQHPGYLNWDIPSDKPKIRQFEIPTSQNLMVFDEIHKYARWRTLMKGFFDRYYPAKQAIVTGSARLDLYRKGGDSLMGRYRFIRLHPYSLMELTPHPTATDLERLFSFSGFPEPLFEAKPQKWRLWQRDRLSRVFQEDLRELERVHEISLLELLLESLPPKVGSPLSLNNLREDLEVSHDSIRKWISIFDHLYLTFRIAPYGNPKIRAVKKEQKLYFWDFTQVEDPGIRFENLVACQLLKYCHAEEDFEGHSMELRYIRDTDKREVDFVVLKKKQPLFAVECKLNQEPASPSIRYFRERLPIPKYFQVHMRGNQDFGNETKDVRVLPFVTFVQELNLP
jgi:predicted AAA+ superfamily ATPase